jgi:hypothetical protein
VNVADWLKRSLTSIWYTSNDPDSRLSSCQVSPALSVSDVSGSSGFAPKNCATGLVGDKRPVAKICSVRVSRPCDTLVENSCPGVGARKPVETEARSPTAGASSKRVANRPVT